MARSKESVVCILDVGSSMSDTTFGESRLLDAKKAVSMLIQQKILFASKDNAGLIVFGSDATNNDLNTDLGGYESVSVEAEVGPLSTDLLRMIPGIEGGSGHGDVADALVVALDLLRKTKGKSSKRIFLVTDAAGPVEDQDQLPAILDQFAAMDCQLDVIGVDFGEDSERARAKSDAKRANEVLLKRICEAAGGEFLPVTDAIDILSSARKRSVKQTTKMRGALQISNACSIPVWTFAKTAEQKLPSMSKLSAPAMESGDGSCAVKMDRVYRSQTDVNVEVSPEERMKGYKYGPQLVPFSAADESTMKYTSERCMKTIAFVDAAKIPRHYFMSTVDCVVPEPGNDRAATGLSALIHALHETNRVGIVRYVKRANSGPWLAVLTPHIPSEDKTGLGDDFECLYLNKLPFADDLREYEFANFNEDEKFAPSLVQLAAAEQLISGLDLTKAHAAAGGATEALAPGKTFNPVLQRFYQALQARALEPGCPLPALDPVIESYVTPDETLFEKNEPFVKAFRNNFELKKNDTKKKKKRRFWGDVLDANEAAAGAGVGAGAGAKKNGDADGDVPMSLDAMFSSGPVDAVGSVDPVKDFNSMLGRRDADLVEKAITGMQTQVKRLVEDGGASFHGKAAECLKALRTGCLANYEEKNFNTYLTSLKQDFEGHASHQGFWKLIVSEGITLINNDESPSADVAHVTPAVAAAFLTSAAAPAPVAAAAPEPEEDDDDDLFDDMA